jgi:HKD family nuclease
MELIIQPFSNQALGDILKAALKGELDEFHTFQAAVAFVKNSGVRHIRSELREFVLKEKRSRLIVGLDHYGTSREGLEGLLQALGEKGEIWVHHCIEKHITFHPKLYLFEGDARALLIIGSGNLTEGGLYTNDEASSLNWLNFENDRDKAVLERLKASLDTWCDENSENARRLDHKFLIQLAEEEYILSETAIQAEIRIKGTETPINGEHTEKLIKTFLFAKTAFKRSAPKYEKSVTPKAKPPKSTQPADLSDDEFEENDKPAGFVMTLQRTDAGSGQTTPGTSRRSPEIFIPLAARDYFPEFWGWQDEFTEDPKHSGKFDRLDVKMRIGGGTVSVNMMTWPAKHDFRLRSEALRSAGNIGDILRIEKLRENGEFSYYVEIVPQGTTAYQDYLKLCTNKTRNSPRVWGYYR